VIELIDVHISSRDKLHTTLGDWGREALRLGLSLTTPSPDTMSSTEALVQSSQVQATSSTLAYDVALLLFRGITKVFFREVRPRGSFNIPRDGPVIFVGAPHSNQVRIISLTSEDVVLIRRGFVVPRSSPCIDGLPRVRATPCFLGRCQEYEAEGCRIPRQEFV
jgi:hypothetical protein